MKTLGLNRFFTRSLAAAGLVIGVALTSFAPAQQMTAEQACTNDAYSFCNEFIPDRDKVGACLRRNARRISPACRSFVVGGGRHVTPGHPYVRHHGVYHHRHHH
jgi:hypothetical protein